MRRIAVVDGNQHALHDRTLPLHAVRKHPKNLEARVGICPYPLGVVRAAPRQLRSRWSKCATPVASDESAVPAYGLAGFQPTAHSVMTASLILGGFAVVGFSPWRFIEPNRPSRCSSRRRWLWLTCCSTPALETNDLGSTRRQGAHRFAGQFFELVVDRDPVKAVALWHGHGGWIGRPALVERAGLHRPLVAINAIAPAAMTAVVNHPSRFASQWFRSSPMMVWSFATWVEFCSHRKGSLTNWLVSSPQQELMVNWPDLHGHLQNVICSDPITSRCER